MIVDGPWGWNAFGAVWLVGGAVLWLIGIAIVLAVVFFTIRFLIIATKAAQLYVERHSPEASAAVPPASTTAPPATKPAATGKPASSTPAASTSKPRTPRKPPAN